MPYPIINCIGYKTARPLRQVPILPGLSSDGALLWYATLRNHTMLATICSHPLNGITNGRTNLPIAMVTHSTESTFIYGLAMADDGDANLSHWLGLFNVFVFAPYAIGSPYYVENSTLTLSQASSHSAASVLGWTHLGQHVALLRVTRLPRYGGTS